MRSRRKAKSSTMRSRRKAKSSAKRSRRKGNSLPPTKRSDFTMVDDDFEESQRGFAPKETNADTKKCVKFFKDLASARNHHSSSTTKMVRNDILLTDTALQLLDVVIRHGVINWQVAGCCLCYEYAWKTWPFYVDSRLGTNCRPVTTTSAFNNSNYPRILRAAIFGKPLTTYSILHRHTYINTN